MEAIALSRVCTGLVLSNCFHPNLRKSPALKLGRCIVRSLVFGCLAAGLLASNTQAAPTSIARLADNPGFVQQVRWTCNQFRCLDQWTGNETAAYCDDDGCHPTRGFARRGPDYGYAPPPRRYGYGYRYAPPPSYGYGYEDE